MPIYEYACTNCDHSLDALQKISDDPLRECPECGEPALKRLLSAPRFRLKGEGWYETDFKRDKQRNLLKSESDSGKSAKTESAAEKTAKTDTKKAEPKTASKQTSGADSE